MIGAGSLPSPRITSIRRRRGRRSPSLPSAPPPPASCWCTACRSIPPTCAILAPGPRRRSPRRRAVSATPRASRVTTIGRPARRSLRARPRFMRARSIRRSSASSSALKPAPAWTRRRSCGCSRRATPTISASSPQPMSFAARRAATPSATSSTATSTTPTSAPTAARSAPSPRARRMRRCAARPMTSRSTKSCAARAKPGSAARPKSAFRAASIRITAARPISAFAAPSRRRSRICTSTPSRHWRSRRARRRSACRSGRFSPSSRTRA